MRDGRADRGRLGPGEIENPWTIPVRRGGNRARTAGPRFLLPGRPARLSPRTDPLTWSRFQFNNSSDLKSRAPGAIDGQEDGLVCFPPWTPPVPARTCCFSGDRDGRRLADARTTASPVVEDAFPRRRRPGPAVRADATSTADGGEFPHQGRRPEARPDLRRSQGEQQLSSQPRSPRPAEHPGDDPALRRENGVPLASWIHRDHDPPHGPPPRAGRPRAWQGPESETATICDAAARDASSSPLSPARPFPTSRGRTPTTRTLPSREAFAAEASGSGLPRGGRGPSSSRSLSGATSSSPAPLQELLLKKEACPARDVHRRGSVPTAPKTGARNRRSSPARRSSPTSWTSASAWAKVHHAIAAGLMTRARRPRRLGRTVIAGPRPWGGSSAERFHVFDRRRDRLAGNVRRPPCGRIARPSAQGPRIGR